MCMLCVPMPVSPVTVPVWPVCPSQPSSAAGATLPVGVLHEVLDAAVRAGELQLAEQVSSEGTDCVTWWVGTNYQHTDFAPHVKLWHWRLSYAWLAGCRSRLLMTEWEVNNVYTMARPV